MVAKWKKAVASWTARILEFVGGPKIGGGLAVGSIVPELQIENWLNGTVDLSMASFDTDGNSTFMEFWSTQCRPCVESVPKIKQIHMGYRNEPVRFVTIHVDLYEPVAIEAIRSFVAEHAISYPVGIDRTGKTWETFAFQHLPHGLLINSNGEVTWSGSLFTHDVRQVLKKHVAKVDLPSLQIHKNQPNSNIQGHCDGDVCQIPTGTDQTDKKD